MQSTEPTSKSVIWCSHQNSPVTEKISKSVIGGGKGLLLCNGDLKSCPISVEKFNKNIED
ncbi:MAG: hypothetical protein PHX60_14980 [Giesbergeria sp.]|uniref:hypothetical protein n=1 Tax=Giesbergeria sp. TaxID=2818473 RepID=UPI002611626E|nr:hypothetical protein [Giesbergeria sp.]MDD2610957.1 hypothetical protein [Giesbergeria sp.]